MVKKYTIVLYFIFFPVFAVGEDWPQYRRDEAHTSWSPITVYPPFERVATIKVDGLTNNKQADVIVSKGNWVSVLGALAGGLPGQAHSSTRTIYEINRTTLKPRKDQPYPFSDPLLIETSTGTWPFMYSERWGYLFESGFLNFYGSTVVKRYSFDIYGIVVGRDFPKGNPNYDVWQLSWEEWHVPSKMWSKTEKDIFWGWMRGVPTSGPNNRPEGYTIIADGVFIDNYLVTNTVVSVGHPEKWDRLNEPPPPGTCGPAVWELYSGKPPISEICGQYGMLSIDKKNNRLWTTRQDWRYPNEEVYDQFRGGQRRPGTSDALLAFSLPDLRLDIIKDGYNLTSDMQEAPLIIGNKIIWLAKRGGEGVIVAFDSLTGEELWETKVNPWVKKQDCSYYRQGYTTSLAASGDTLVHAGNGIDFINSNTGEIVQHFNEINNNQESKYFNPIFIDGELWVLRCYGNILNSYFVGNDPLPSNIEIPDGWVLRVFSNSWFALKYDGEAPPLLKSPKQHSGFNCGGYQVEVFKPKFISQPEVSPTIVEPTKIPVNIDGFIKNKLNPISGVVIYY